MTWERLSSAATVRSSALKSIIKQLQRSQFGRRSERLDPDQLALASSSDHLFADEMRERRCPSASTSALSRRACALAIQPVFKSFLPASNSPRS
ncbi:MAG: hypothetical protein E5W83_02120 [Mesorhizobium sp.]|nr:MAG: hypothetical protein E5W83_02120 [Mesorhizobium sp.]